jgi:hypothetical protein
MLRIALPAATLTRTGKPATFRIEVNSHMKIWRRRSRRGAEVSTVTGARQLGVHMKAPLDRLGLACDKLNGGDEDGRGRGAWRTNGTCWYPPATPASSAYISLRLVMSGCLIATRKRAPPVPSAEMLMECRFTTSM